MNKGSISNILRSFGLLHPLDNLRYKNEQRKNSSANSKFKAEHPNIPLPPDYLMYESFKLNYSKYYQGGKETAKWLIELLEKNTTLENKKILDWGCGPARIVRHLPQLLPVSNIYATDYNAESINWCKENIKDVDFNHNRLEALLPYDDNYFDVIYGISILTHLSEKMHTNWITELRRNLKPDGLLLLTTQGNNFKSKLSTAENIKFDKGELIVRGNVKEGHRTYSAFHPDTYLELLFRDFDIIDKLVVNPTGKSYIPQDTWLLKKI